MSGALQLQVNKSTADLVYDYALSSAYRSQWVFDPSGALLKDPDVWEIVRNDVSFLSSIERSAKAIVRPWRVEAPKGAKDKLSKSFAAICEEGLGYIDRFNASRRILADARFIARRYAYIESEVRWLSLDGLPQMEWTVPVKLKDIDRRRFHWVAEVTQAKDGTQHRATHLELWNSLTNRWTRVEPWFRKCLIEYVYGDTEDRVGYGRGLLEAIYFGHYMKTQTFAKIMQGIDRWAGGVWIGKLDSLRNASTGKTNEDLRLGMRRLLQIMRSENAAVLQDGDEIEVKETTGTGHQISMDTVHYWDDAVERLCNGSTRPSGQGGEKTGARAQAETESDTSEAFYQDDREDLDAVLNRDLLGWFIAANQHNFAKLGMLEKCKRPYFTSEQIKKQDPKEAVEVAQGLQTMGFPLSLAEVAEKTGFSIADPEEEKLEAPALPGPDGEIPGGAGSGAKRPGGSAKPKAAGKAKED